MFTGCVTEGRWEFSMDELKRRPDAHKIIVIKGMCRMGDVLEKKHISFGMETAKFSIQENAGRRRLDAVRQAYVERI